MPTKTNAQSVHPQRGNPDERLLGDSFDDVFEGRTEHHGSRDREHRCRDGEHHKRDGEHKLDFVSRDAPPDPSVKAVRVRSVDTDDVGLATGFRVVAHAGKAGRTFEKRHGGGADSPAAVPMRRPLWSETAIAIWELERYAWHGLGQNGRDRAIEAVMSPNGKPWRAFVVAPEVADYSGEGGGGVTAAGRVDADVLLATLFLAKTDRVEAKSWCQSRAIISIPKIIRAMHPAASAAERRAAIGGGNKVSVIEALKRLHRLRIVPHKAILPDAPSGVPLRLFKFFDLGELNESGEPNGPLTIEVEDWVHVSLAKHVRLISLPEYFSIKLPAARRLYRYLECRRWVGKNERNEFELSLAELVRDLPILQTRRAHILATLDAAHDELRRLNYLLEAPYGADVRRVSVGGGVHGAGLYRLRPWQPLKASMLTPDVADAYKSLVEEWVKVLDEPGNRTTRGFAWKACIELGEVNCRRLIDAARTALTRGKSVEQVRTAITARAVGLMGGSPEDWK